MTARLRLATVRAHLETQIFRAWAVDGRGLALYRISFAAVALLVLLPSSESLWTLEYPRAAITPPPGLMPLMPEILYSPWLVGALHALVAAGLALVLVGWRTRESSLGVAAAWVLLLGVGYSFNKIDHNVVVALVPLLLASYWGSAWSLDARTERPPAAMPPWLMAFAAWILSLLMLSAAVPKLLSGWLDPTTGAVDAIMEQQFLVHGRDALLAGVARNLPWNVGLELLDWGAVVLEGCFVFAVVSQYRLRFVLAAALTFHLAVAMSMNIAFVGNVVLYALFVPLGALSARLARSPAFLGARAYLNRRSTATVVCGALATLTPCSLLLAYSSTWLVDTELFGLPFSLWTPTLVVTAGGIVGALVLLSRLRKALMGLRRVSGTLLFDEDCAFCTRYAAWAAGRMRRATVLGWQSHPGLLEQHGLTANDGMTSSWWVDDHESPIGGERTIARSLIAMTGIWPLLGLALLVPGISYASAVGYRLIAENRSLMPGGTASCRVESARVAER